MTVIQILTIQEWWICVVMLSAFVGVFLIDILPLAIRAVITFPLLLVAISYGIFEQFDADVSIRTMIVRLGLFLMGFALTGVSVWYHGEKDRILAVKRKAQDLEAEKIKLLREMEDYELRNENLIRRTGILLHENESLRTEIAAVKGRK